LSSGETGSPDKNIEMDSQSSTEENTSVESKHDIESQSNSQGDEAIAESENVGDVEKVTEQKESFPDLAPSRSMEFPDGLQSVCFQN